MQRPLLTLSLLLLGLAAMPCPAQAGSSSAAWGDTGVVVSQYTYYPWTSQGGRLS